TEHVGLRIVEVFEEILAQNGAQAVDVPGNEFHTGKISDKPDADKGQGLLNVSFNAFTPHRDPLPSDPSSVPVLRGVEGRGRIERSAVFSLRHQSLAAVDAIILDSSADVAATLPRCVTKAGDRARRAEIKDQSMRMRRLPGAPLGVPEVGGLTIDRI